MPHPLRRIRRVPVEYHQFSMDTPEPRNYYLRWLARTFRGPWGLSSLAGSILALLVPLALRYAPAAKLHATVVNDLVWQVPLGLFIALAAIRFLRVPHELHAEESACTARAEDQLRAITGEHRPYVVVTRHEEWIEDDPNADEPYTREYLRFTNIGPEAALTISLEPVVLGDHDVTLWEPINVLKKDEHRDCLPRGGISSGLERMRKAGQLEYTKEIRFSLVAKYTDRQGHGWTTPHEIVARGHDVQIQPVHTTVAVEQAARRDMPTSVR